MGEFIGFILLTWEWGWVVGITIVSLYLKALLR